MKTFKKTIGVIFFALIISVMYLPKIDNTNIITSKNTYMADNEEDKDVLYVETTEGNIKNKYTKDNPLILTPNENIIFHISFKPDEYNTKKDTVASTVYDNEVSQEVNVLNRNYYDQWFDEFQGLRFGFKANAFGDCRVVIHNKNDWGDSIETLYVRVVPADSIQVKDPNTGNYLYNQTDVNVNVESTLELRAVFTSGLNMDGEVPSEQYFAGSGFWSWDVPITNEWTKLENNKWLSTVKIATEGVGNFTVGLGRNGNGQVGSLNIHVVQNKIALSSIKIGTRTYNDVNKNIATRMVSGINSGDNSASNRYFVYTGETFAVNAEVPEGYRFELANSSTLKVAKESSFKNNKVTASFTGINPGDNEIQLKNANGDVTEVFFVQTRYPIYVEGFDGEMFKDYLHEYLDHALGGLYDEHPEYMVLDNTLTPQYVKNGGDYYRFYYLDGNTVKLTTYVNSTDDRDFEIEGDIAMKNHKVEEITTGDKAGFKKISAEFYLTVNTSGGVVKVGWDTFFIAGVFNDQKVNHLDVQTADGSKLVSVKKKSETNTELVEEETEYYANLTGVHYSTIYDSNNNELLTINRNEYWQTSPDTSTQYESTSAYLTNNSGHLIDNSNTVIDDKVKQGQVDPVIKSRNISYTDIDHIVFKVDIVLKPKIKRVKKYQKDSDGNKTLVDVTEEQIVNEPDRYLNDYEIVMDGDKIHLALNKCPYHSGLDFTFKLDIRQIPKEVFIDVPNTLKNTSIITIGIMILSSFAAGYGLILYKKKK